VISRGSLQVGDELIDFTLPRLGGGEVTLSEFSGKPILLDFWATWCGPCRAAAPGLAAITARFGDEIQIIGVNMDMTPGLAIQYAQGAGLTYPHAFSQGWRDPVIREYGIHRTGIPFNVLFDAKGRVAAMDLHGQPLADALELLLRRE
jgi:thiol-disulfide isomerase/thioredoxin